MKIINPSSYTGLDAIRDPMILRDNGKYYMVGTSPEFWEGPNPGVRLWSSDNLIDWKFECKIIDSSLIDDNKPYKDRFWAPEIFKYKGKYYCTFNAQNEKLSENFSGLRSYVAVSDCITGPYIISEEPMVESENLTNDAHLFADDDGKVYLFFSSLTEKGSNIYVAEFSTETCKIVTEQKLCIPKGADGEWDSIGIEGSFVVKKNGIYYHWYSSWTRSYEMGLAMTDDLSKPFVKCDINPIISGFNKETEFTYCGHNSCFELPDGRDAIAFHVNSDKFRESLCINTIEYPVKESKKPDSFFEL